MGEILRGDAHSDTGHLLIDVYSCVISPGLLNLLAIFTNDLGITGHMTGLERWRHKLALVMVEVTSATEDAITDDHPFVEVIGMLDQNAMDMLWLIKQNACDRPKMHAADVAFLRHSLHEA